MSNKLNKDILDKAVEDMRALLGTPLVCVTSVYSGIVVVIVLPISPFFSAAAHTASLQCKRNVAHPAILATAAHPVLPLASSQAMIIMIVIFIVVVHERAVAAALAAPCVNLVLNIKIMNSFHFCSPVHCALECFFLGYLGGINLVPKPMMMMNASQQLRETQKGRSIPLPPLSSFVGSLSLQLGILPSRLSQLWGQVQRNQLRSRKSRLGIMAGQIQVFLPKLRTHRQL